MENKEFNIAFNIDNKTTKRIDEIVKILANKPWATEERELERELDKLVYSSMFTKEEIDTMYGLK